MLSPIFFLTFHICNFHFSGLSHWRQRYKYLTGLTILQLFAVEELPPAFWHRLTEMLHCVPFQIFLLTLWLFIFALLCCRVTYVLKSTGWVMFYLTRKQVKPSDSVQEFLVIRLLCKCQNFSPAIFANKGCQFSCTGIVLFHCFCPLLIAKYAVYIEDNPFTWSMNVFWTSLFTSVCFDVWRWYHCNDTASLVAVHIFSCQYLEGV